MLSKLTVEQLKSELSKLNLDTTGTKPILLARLTEAWNEEDSMKPNDGEKVCNTPKLSSSEEPASTSNNSEPMARISLKDVEGLISKFSGDDNYSVETWLREFEEIACLLKWSEVEKFVFAKRQLTGSARCFIKMCRNTSYQELKKNLCTEFEIKVCKGDIYNKLQNRKMQRHENFRTYLYEMQELGQLADIDEKSLIHYIVNGIPGREEHKIILYDARTIADLKDKYSTYEKFIFKFNAVGDNNNWKKRNENYYRKSENLSQSAQHCFNCGSTGHRRKDCKVETKCFRCNGLGHMSSTCPHSSKQTNIVSVLNSKTILINDVQFQALVDTGAEISLLREDAFRKLDNVQLRKDQIKLVGLASGNSISLGSFYAKIAIDDVKLETSVVVVPNNAINFQAVIGSDVISQAKVVFDNNGPSFYNPGEANIMHIQVEENAEVNAPYPFGQEIEDLETNYRPKHIKSCPIEIIITLTDESPIYTSLRRLPIKEEKDHTEEEKAAKTSNNNIEVKKKIKEVVEKREEEIEEGKETKEKNEQEKGEKIEGKDENKEERDETKGKGEKKGKKEKKKRIDVKKKVKDKNKEEKTHAEEEKKVESSKDHIKGKMEKQKVDEKKEDEKKKAKEESEKKETKEEDKKKEELKEAKEGKEMDVTMRKKEDIEILQIVEEELLHNFDAERKLIRNDARQQIEKLQAENKKTFNRKRKAAQKYKVGDLVAIKRTQFKTGRKLSSDFLGPYEVVSGGRGNRYTVRKGLFTEGPGITTTGADFMKPWRQNEVDDIIQSSSEADDMQDGRM